MKRSLSILAAAAALLVLPALASAAGIAGATVKLISTADGTEFGSAVTDAGGAFAFEGIPEGSWMLGVGTADGSGQSWLSVAVPAEQAPARLGGAVSARDGADFSLEVSASFAPADDVPGIILDEGYPHLQRAWNLNWGHANGRLLVRLAGTGLDGLELVSLTSAAGSVETTSIFQDPETGEYVAVFPKKAAFAALVPAGAVRGDTVALAVGVVTAADEASFGVSVRIVGPNRPPKR